ncbi:MAG: hypothetical protein E7624_04335 [Ruminococcaceae bacterium]|nr:hypothetical protein [Oscillospiraceae bacterium]
MKQRFLCLLLALLMLFSLTLVSCDKDPVDSNPPSNGEGDGGGGNGGGQTGTEDTSTTEHYLPEALFANVKEAYEKSDASNFPALNYDEAPFAIADDAFAGKKITEITLPVQETGAADADGNLCFTLYVMPNTYEALSDDAKTGVTAHTVKIKPADYGLEAGKKAVCKYITVDLTSYKLQLTEAQTIAIGAKEDTVMIAAMDTSATTSATAEVIKDWREQWLVTGYHINLFKGALGKENGGVYFTRDSLPVDFVFDYGTPAAKKAVLDARKAEEDAYAAKLAAVAEAYDGKYLSLIGDSISSFRGICDNTDYNAALINNRCYYGASYMNDYTQMYWGRLAYECNMELCVINGWSTSRVYGGGSDKNDHSDATLDNMLVRSTTLHNKEGQSPDLIVLYMGTNDIGHSKTWSDLYDRLEARGSKTQKEIVAEWLEGVHSTYQANSGNGVQPGKTYKSWEAAYALSLERMQYNYPDAEICIVNLIQTNNTVRTGELVHKANVCLAALAEYYGVMVADQANNTVNRGNCHYYGADEATPQSLHPNLMGHAMLTKLIVETLYENLPKD